MADRTAELSNPDDSKGLVSDSVSLGTQSAIIRDYSLSRQRTKASQADPTIIDLGGEAGYSFAYSAAQAPAIGLAQLADRGVAKLTDGKLKTKLAETVDLMPAPEADFGSARWHAQQIGGAFGMVAPFALTRGTMRATGLTLVARTEATLANSGRLFTAMKGASIADAALTGFAYDFAMTPVAAGEKDFWKARRDHGLTGAATFATMEVGSTLLRHGTRSLASELTGARRVGYDVATGALPGIPAGAVNADASSWLSKGHLATGEERIKGAYTMFFVGGSVSGLRLLPGQEAEARERASVEENKGRSNLEKALTERAFLVRDRANGPPENSERRSPGSQSKQLVQEGQLEPGRAMAGGDVQGKPLTPPKRPPVPTLGEVTRQHLQEFQDLLTKPLEEKNPNAQMRAWNDAVLQADGFIRNHRSVLLEDAIRDWARNQDRPEIRDFVDWAYEGKRSQARRSNYLMDLAMAEGKAAGLDTLQMMHLGYARGNFFQETKGRVNETQQNATVDTLLRLMEDGRDPRRNPASEIVPGNMEKKAALQMLMQAGEPTRIVQYNHPTCALGALEVDMYTRNPDKVTAAVSEVLRTGEFTTSDGTVIKVDKDSLRAERGSNRYGDETFRSYASEVFQTLASNVHWQRQTVAPDGRTVPKGSLSYILRVQPSGDTIGYIMDKSGPSPRRFDSGGYNETQVKEIGMQIGGPDTVPKYMPNNFPSPDAMARYLTAERGQENFPKIMVIDARHLNPAITQSPAWHAITVTGAYNILGSRTKPVDVVNWHNTWEGRTYPQNLSIKQLWEMAFVKPPGP